MEVVYGELWLLLVVAMRSTTLWLETLIGVELKLVVWQLSRVSPKLQPRFEPSSLVVHGNCGRVGLYVTTRGSHSILLVLLSVTLGVLMAGSLSPSATLGILFR